ncbi:MAG: alpha/beta hydrolase-fold protein [Pseudobdellovibrionaceae bacterium]
MPSFKTILLLLYVSVNTFAQTPNQEDVQSERTRFTCDSDSAEGTSFSFCYRNADTTNNNDIVYFFHGLGGSEETWFTQFFGTLMIQNWWQLKGYKPRIVTVSFGRQWLLVNNERDSLLPLFTNKVMPFLERKIGGLKNGHRHLIGESMGGFNAAEVALKNPGLFSRVALLCPAITTIGPFSSSDQIEEYIERTGALTYMVQRMLKISRSIFINESDWEKHNPLTLIKNYRYPKRSKFFVSTGIWDTYGFQEGSRQFSQFANAHSFFSIWAPVPGPHCNFNRYMTANFIMGD